MKTNKQTHTQTQWEKNMQIRVWIVNGNKQKKNEKKSKYDD